MTLHHPLNWPPRQARAKSRRPSQFVERTLTQAVGELENELTRMGAKEVHLSTNVPVTTSGYFMSGRRLTENDPGVAVYFTRKGIEHAMAADAYTDLPDNVWALVKTIEAMRAIERHGSADLADQAFTGFAALPAPAALEPWHVVLGVSPSAPDEVVQAAYRTLARTAHPDAGGSDERMSRLNRARESWEASK